jgi:hypothetical protein
MRADDDGFVFQRRVRAFQNADDVVGVRLLFYEIDFENPRRLWEANRRI